MTMRVLDSHVHLWTIGGPGQTWPDANWPALYRDFLPEDFHAAIDGIDLVGAVLVQSQPDDRDTDWICAVAAGEPLIQAIVGWAALDVPEARQRIAELASRPRLRGLRPMLQAIPDTEWLMGSALVPAVEAMIEQNLRFDALVQPRHLPMLARFADRWPELPIVVDHAAKPFAADGILDPWRDDLSALAERPNVWCKLSGLRTEQAPGQSGDALVQYIHHVLSAFGDKTMWGSDWPVILHAGDSYDQWLTHARALAGALDPARLDRLFEGAARSFYGLDEKEKR